jgi:peptide-methionine (R)-S-oxide reductase
MTIPSERAKMKNGPRMQRRRLLKWMFTGIVAPVSVPVMAFLKLPPQSPRAEDHIAKLEKAKSEWRKLLPEDAYTVLFEERTEARFTSPLDKEKRQGSYVCAACYLPLFSSKAKYDSGTGWPSFFEPIEGHVGTKRDYRMIIPRIEYHCIRCGGHQGHLFDDGPPPTRQRWCNNGVALRFVPEGEPLPTLRS